MITREDCVKIGVVTKTHHLQGAVVITTDSDLIEQYADEPVFLYLDGAPVPFFIAEDGLSVRNHTSYIVRFDYVDSLEQAERLVGCDVLLERALLEEEQREENRDDIGQWIGFRIEDEVSGQSGELTDVADYAGNIVLTMVVGGKEVLLPFSEEYIQEIDIPEKLLKVRIPGELADLNE